MRIDCPYCLKKARITSRNYLNEEKTVSELYCECTDRDCQARFVFSLSLKHHINPPAPITQELIQNLINRMSQEELGELQKKIASSAYSREAIKKPPKRV
ncbi:ogr/Delta-like zinc finger family protein [Methylosarcina fibrata]|uniref:ogr/Delta-like zinc finger family protein n=1 Tax=Methylosarcina fibrata TaxID=105972 RepID=UPI00037199B9